MLRLINATPGKLLTAALCAGALGVPPLAAQEPVTAGGEFIGTEGQSHGTAVLTQAPLGVLIRVELTGLPEGAFGFHLHETGVCEPPFESAGEHFNPANSPHGYFAEGGPDAGDLPNIHVPASGELTVEAFNTLVSLQEGNEASLLDDDGSALMIHAMPDDYASQPSGESGDRIACAVIAQ